MKNKVIEIQRTKLLYFIASYTLFVSSITIFQSIIPLFKYFKKYNFGLILTNTGTGLILPITPSCRIILAILGLVGAFFLLRKKMIGYWVTMLWAFLQIPNLTFIYQPLTKNIAHGLMSINLQLFFAGRNFTHSEEILSAFSNTSSIYTSGIGINFIGIVILILLFLLWLQWNTEYRVKIIGLSKRTFERVFNSLTLMLILTLLSFAFQYYITVVAPNPKVEIKINKIDFKKEIVFVSNEDKTFSIITDMYLSIKNTGLRDTTIDKIFIELEPRPKDWFCAVGAMTTYYPYNLKLGKIKNYDQTDLWSKIRDAKLKSNPFSKIRIKSNDTTTCTMSFIIPFEALYDLKMEDGRYSIIFGGRAVAITVPDERIESKIEHKWSLISGKFQQVNISDLKQSIF